MPGSDEPGPKSNEAYRVSVVRKDDASGEAIGVYETVPTDPGTDEQEAVPSAVLDALSEDLVERMLFDLQGTAVMVEGPEPAPPPPSLPPGTLRAVPSVPPPAPAPPPASTPPTETGAEAAAEARAEPPAEPDAPPDPAPLPVDALLLSPPPSRRNRRFATSPVSSDIGEVLPAPVLVPIPGPLEDPPTPPTAPPRSRTPRPVLTSAEPPHPSRTRGAPPPEPEPSESSEPKDLLDLGRLVAPPTKEPPAPPSTPVGLDGISVTDVSLPAETPAPVRPLRAPEPETLPTPPSAARSVWPLAIGVMVGLAVLLAVVLGLLLSFR